MCEVGGDGWGQRCRLSVCLSVCDRPRRSTTDGSAVHVHHRFLHLSTCYVDGVSWTTTDLEMLVRPRERPRSTHQCRECPSDLTRILMLAHVPCAGPKPHTQLLRGLVVSMTCITPKSAFSILTRCGREGDAVRSTKYTRSPTVHRNPRISRPELCTTISSVHLQTLQTDLT